MASPLVLAISGRAIDLGAATITGHGGRDDDLCSRPERMLGDESGDLRYLCEDLRLGEVGHRGARRNVAAAMVDVVDLDDAGAATGASLIGGVCGVLRVGECRVGLHGSGPFRLSLITLSGMLGPESRPFCKFF